MWLHIKANITLYLTNMCSY